MEAKLRVLKAEMAKQRAEADVYVWERLPSYFEGASVVSTNPGPLSLVVCTSVPLSCPLCAMLNAPSRPRTNSGSRWRSGAPSIGSVTRYDKDVHERVARAPAVTEGRTGKRPPGAAGAAAGAGTTSSSPRSAAGTAPTSGRSGAPSSPSVDAPSVPHAGADGNPALRRARPSSSRKALKPEGAGLIGAKCARGSTRRRCWDCAERCGGLLGRGVR
jgi:hypothetical protein